MTRQRLLLDSNVLLWLLGDRSRLNDSVVNLVVDPATTVAYSPLSIWELFHKYSVGKLKLPTDFLQYVEDADFAELNVTSKHAHTAATLPPHHRDPLDRFLIAQALCEHFTIVTADKQFAAYTDNILLV